MLLNIFADLADHPLLLSIAVAECYGQSVGCMVGMGYLFEMKEELHHPLHLRFSGSSPAQNRFLDFQRTVLSIPYASLRQTQENDSARFGDRHRCLDVLGKEKAFQCRFPRLEFLQYGIQGSKEVNETLSPRLLSIGLNHSMRDMKV
jgi:hypothetical protein